MFFNYFLFKKSFKEILDSAIYIYKLAYMGKFVTFSLIGEIIYSEWMNKKVKR